MDRYLPVGYELHLNGRIGKYIITGIIGKGASTVAYCADYYCDDGNCSKHIIKEFNPSYISFQRTENGEMQFTTSDKSRVTNAKERFLSGCYNQIKIRNQIATMNQTPPIEGPFYANDTIYTDVIAYNGTTYDVAYKKLSLCDRMKVCLSVAKLVKCYHDAGYLCLDIKPENIFVIPETKELLYFIDFDSICTKEEIAFGNSISYTKQWAALEQLNPYAIDEISEATDIYAVGELVFWSVFERHSKIEEHRGFSVYPFEDIRPQISNILAKLFHNTLRPSVSSRFKSINNVIALLKEIIEEQSKKEYIIASAIRPKDFFVGREKELAELDNRLKEEKIIFLYGIGGIGKSEIAKQYAILNARKYQNILYWTFNEDFESTICQDDSVSISNISRVEDESDHSYCWRKLRAIKGCLQNNNLIIIDNLNCRLEDVQSQEVWEFLLTFPCEIIVTTRSSQMEHELPVREIADFSILKKIFSYNCPYENNQDEHVDKIIRCVDGHTLLLELIAKQTCTAGRSPKETLILLEKHGVYGTGKEAVGMIKDGHRTRETVFNHMRNIFSISDMSFEQKLMITKAAFLPEIGTTFSNFSAYYKLEDKNDVNWLVENGWIYRSSDSEHILSVHPVVVEVVISELKNNPELQNAFYEDAIDAFKWNPKTIVQINHIQLSASIATKTIKSEISSRSVAIYLMRYVHRFSSYGNSSYIAEQLKYAISLLEGNIPEQKYSAALEYAYITYIPYVKTQSSLDEAIELCRTHLAKTKKAKDFYLLGKYYSLLSDLLMNKHQPIDGSLKEYYVALSNYFVSYYYCGKIRRDLKRKKPKYTSSEHLINDLDYDYLEKSKSNFEFNLELEFATYYESMNSNVLFCMKPHKYELRNLQYAINIRRRIIQDRKLRLTRNSIEIVVDEARILYLEQKYDEAKLRLNEVVDMFKCGNRLPTMSLYRVHQFLGNIAATTGDYETAVDELKRCLEISEELQVQDNYLVNVQLGRFLNENGDIEESEEHNTAILAVVEQLNNNARKSFLGDTLYNLATLQNMKGKPNTALKTFVKAIDEYTHCNARIEFIEIGKARCYRKMHEIYQQYDSIEQSKIAFKLAKDAYFYCLGNKHPEVVEFLSKTPQEITSSNDDKTS